MPAVDLRGWRLLGRAFALRQLAVSTCVAIAATWSVSPTPVAVPGRDGVRSLLWPLTPVVVACVVPRTATAAYRWQERLASRRGWSLRVAAVGSVLTSALLVGAAGVRFDSVVVVRNGVLLVGLALLATVALPRGGGWLPVVALALVMWLVGMADDGRPRAWAVLLQPRHSATATATAVVTALVGIAAYVVVGRAPD